MMIMIINCGGKTDYIANAYTTHPPMFAYTGVLGSTNMFLL